ncbi:MAG TPA: hypothetical protein VGN64_04990 [Dyadobacter sp.]|jgi:hypothetical protein|nr:hypothetical protein [Dyadobacter sp.]
MEKSDVKCVEDFIEMVWNQSRLDLLNQYLHPAFRDYSQPFFAVQNTDGLKMYLRQLNGDVIHKTEILDVEIFKDVVILEVRLVLKLKCSDCAQKESEQLLVIEGERRFTMRENLIYDHREHLEISSSAFVIEDNLRYNQ